MADPEPEVRQELRSRRISTEEIIREALVALHRVRLDLNNPNRVQAWSEGVEALADIVEPYAAMDDQFRAEWQNRPMRIKRIRHPSGRRELDRLVPFPKASDCREAERIIRSMLDRQGLFLKRRTVSGPRRPNDDAEGLESGQDEGKGGDPLLGAV